MSTYRPTNPPPTDATTFEFETPLSSTNIPAFSLIRAKPTVFDFEEPLTGALGEHVKQAFRPPLAGRNRG